MVDVVQFDFEPQDNAARGIFFSTTLDKMFLNGNENDKVYEYDLINP